MKFYYCLSIFLLINCYTNSLSGQSGEALDFGGTSEYLSVGNLGPVTDWTFELWIKPNAATDYQNIFDSSFQNGDNANSVRLETSSSSPEGHLYLAVSGSSVLHTYTIVPTSTPLSTDWQHIAIVGNRTQNNLIVYHDGVEVVNVTHTDWPERFEHFVMGHGHTNSGNKNYLGKIDEFRFWKEARTASEIQNNKDVEISGTEANLEAYYQFNQGSANGDNSGENTLIDLTNNHPGTLNLFSLNGTSSNWVGNGFPRVLPVELSDFKLKKTAKTIQLYWKTASELDNEKFEIETSENGRDFHKIGEVKGNGTSSVQHSYAFEIKNPSNGLHYYRLKQVDYNSKFEYSKILSADFEKQHESIGALYPNPTRTGLVSLNYESQNATDLSISIYDMTGRIVYHKISPSAVGRSQATFDLSDLKTGIYFVLIGEETHPVYRKLIVE